MPYNPYMLKDFDETSGIRRDLEPWLIPEKAWVDLEDCYIWRGRLKRRQGYSLLGRFQRNLTAQSLGNTDLAGSLTVNIISHLTLESSASIVPGSIAIHVGAQTFTEPNLPDGTLNNGSGGIGTINYATGALTIHTNPVLATTAVTINFSYNPNLPVMTLKFRELVTSTLEQQIGFDTKYAYVFTGGSWQELVPGTTWQGSNSNFFWVTNYFQDSSQNPLYWATNFNAPGVNSDPIRYFNGSTWTNFSPTLNGSGSQLQQALILVPYKDRLLAMNTFEGNSLAASVQFPQRLRFSQNGDPTDQTNGWRDDIPGKGGFIDAPTNDTIVSAEFVKDILLVKFNKTSWKIIYTGNELQPFIWQKINTEFGAESTFSMVPFDTGVLSVGDVAITIDTGDSVQRIDLQIPGEVFNFENENNGPVRVHGIRDYYNELVYWTFPLFSNDRDTDELVYPDQVLVYNYRNQTYAIFNDSFTCYGYFFPATDITWAQMTIPWLSANRTWNSGISQQAFPDVIAGNQQGFVLLLNQGTGNGASLYISAVNNTIPANPIITSPSHNLNDNEYIQIINCIGLTGINGNIYQVIVIDQNTFSFVIDDISFPILPITGTYLGGGQIIVLNNIFAQSKVFAPFYEIGKEGRLGWTDFLFDRTTGGQVSVDVFIDESVSDSLNNPNNENIPTGTLIGSNIVNTKPETNQVFNSLASKLWHRCFTYADGQNFMFEISMNNTQMRTPSIQQSDIVLHAMNMWLDETGRLTP